MKRKAQSILDILLPNRMMMVLQSPVTNKEAKTLMKLWECDHKDQYGRVYVSQEIDGDVIVSLATKGYLSTAGTTRNAIVSNKSASAVTLTKKAKEIIKKIILATEESSFDSTEEPDYESILIMAEKKVQSKGKVASKQFQPEPSRSLNWLQKRAQDYRINGYIW